MNLLVPQRFSFFFNEINLCFILLASTGKDIESIDTKSESDNFITEWPGFVEGFIRSDKGSADELIIEQLNSITTKNSEEKYSKMPITPPQIAPRPMKTTKKRYHIVPLLKVITIFFYFH